jgi:hypothetical protein
LSFDEMLGEQWIDPPPGPPLELALLLFESMPLGGSHHVTQRAGRSSTHLILHDGSAIAAEGRDDVPARGLAVEVLDIHG